MNSSHLLTKTLVDQPLLLHPAQIPELVRHNEHLEVCLLAPAVVPAFVLDLEAQGLQRGRYALLQGLPDGAEAIVATQQPHGGDINRKYINRTLNNQALTLTRMAYSFLDRNCMMDCFCRQPTFPVPGPAVTARPQSSPKI